MLRRILAAPCLALLIGMLTIPASWATAPPTVGANSVLPAVQGSAAPLGDLTVVEAASGQLPVGDVVTFQFKDSTGASTLHFASTPTVGGTNGLAATVAVASSSGTLNDLVRVTITQASSGPYPGVLTVAQLTASLDGAAATGADQVLVSDVPPSGPAVIAASGTPTTTSDATVITSGTLKATFSASGQAPVLSTSSQQQASSLTITEPAKAFFHTGDVITLSIRDARGSADTVGLATTPAANGGGMQVAVSGISGSTVQQNESAFKLTVTSQDAASGSASTISVTNLVYNTAQAPLGPITVTATVTTGAGTEYIVPGRVTNATVGGNTVTTSAGQPTLSLGTADQAAANVTITVSPGSLKPGDTFSLGIAETGVTFAGAASPDSSVTVGNLVLGATHGVVDGTGKTATWTVTSANTVPSTVVLGPIYYDVATAGAGAVAGHPVSVTTSGSGSSAFTSQTVVNAQLAPASATQFTATAAPLAGSSNAPVSELPAGDVSYQEVAGQQASTGGSIVLLSPYATQIAAYRTTFAAIPTATVTAGSGLVLGTPTVNASAITVVTPTGVVSAPAQTAAIFPVTTGSTSPAHVTFTGISYKLGAYVPPGAVVGTAVLDTGAAGSGSETAGNQYVNAIDGNGLENTGVDSTPPDTVIDSGPSGTVYSNNAAFTFHSTEINSTFHCTLVTPNSTVSQSCTSPMVYPSLANGTYTFQVAATDSSYNTDITPASRQFTVTADTTAPTASFGASTLTAVPVTFSEAVKAVSSTNLVLTLAGSTAPIAGGVSCRDSSGATVACFAGPVTTARFVSAAPLVPGQHYTLTLDPASAATPITDLAGNPLALTTKAFRGSLVQQETSLAGTMHWRKVAASAATGGSYAVSHEPGSTATLQFTGTSVTWHTVTGPNQGTAYASVDGVRKLSVNNYAKATHYGVARTISGLSAGPHRLQILVRGVKGSSSATDSLVAVDDVVVGTTTTDSTSGSMVYAWRHVKARAASAGGYATDNLTGAEYDFTFRGTAISWYTLTAANQGKARVYVDGVLKATVDNYSSATTYGVRRAFGGLTDQVHTLKIVITGARKAAKGNEVAIDRLVVS